MTIESRILFLLFASWAAAAIAATVRIAASAAVETATHLRYFSITATAVLTSLAFTEHRRSRSRGCCATKLGKRRWVSSIINKEIPINKDVTEKWMLCTSTVGMRKYGALD